MMVADPLPTRFAAETLFTERFVCAVRPDHPIFSAQMTLVAYAAANHLLITERADPTGHVDGLLAEKGLSRRVAVTVPSAALVGTILKATNLVATVGARAGQRMAADGGLRLLELPFETKPWRMSLIWLARNAGDEGLAWMRAQLLDAAGTSIS